MKNPALTLLASTLCTLMLGCSQSYEDSHAQLPPTATPPPAPAKQISPQYKREAESRARIAPQLQMEMAADSLYLPPPAQLNRENYQAPDANGVISVSQQPLSTFSIDVDTASYANVRRLLNAGQLPPGNAVRTEEFLNSFSYHYPHPDSTEQPFSVSTEIAPAPWNSNNYLLRIGLQGYQVDAAQLPPSHLVFLVDVSGSMQAADKLPLLQQALKLLTAQLTAQDSVAIVTYAGNAGVVLEPTSGAEKSKILTAIDNLRAGGSTYGSAGIEMAYQLAAQTQSDGANSRVILCSDGDLNVGIVDTDALKDLIARKREQRIYLTTLGFGSGNYNDHLMEQLADVGNGNAGYIDSLQEARKLLVDNRGATLLTIAEDVKIQIEFSPQVAEYRLLGYENRLLDNADFNNDKVDAGEIGAGHSVTALYELTLAGDQTQIDPLRYQPKTNQAEAPAKALDELAFIKLRYKRPGESQSQRLTQVLKRDAILPLSRTSDDFRWAAAVAAFAEQLKGGSHLGQFGYADIFELAVHAKGDDRLAYRAEMTQLIRQAQQLQQGATPLAGQR